MFRIGEFSKLTQVAIRMLRYYDEAGLLKPAEIDSWTGYRLYSADQIARLNQIVFLRDSGFQVAEIENLLNNWSPDFIMAQLEYKKKEIEKNIQEDQKKLDNISIASKDLLQEKSGMHYQVTIKNIPSYSVLSLRRILPDYYGEGLLWKEMTAFAEENNLTFSNNTFTIYHDPEYKTKDIDMEICAYIDNPGENKDGFVFRNTEPVPYMASTMITGSFYLINDAYLALANWLQKNSKYHMSGTSRQIVHRGPWNEEDPEQYLIEIQIPLEIN